MRPGGGRGPVWILAVLVTLGLWWFQNHSGGEGQPPRSETGVAVEVDNGALFEAIEGRRSGVWVEGFGHVDRVLSDDRSGDRHQRFVLGVGHGHTVLIAHNIDLADRVPVQLGDVVTFRGRFEWNDRGGVVHWTHADPQRGRVGGWIRFGETTFR